MTALLPLLISQGVQPSAARRFAQPLQQACADFGINSQRRLAAFLAQCAHESADFTRLEENLFYTSPDRIRAVWPLRVPTTAMAQGLTRRPQALADQVYAGRNGNGATHTGDGWRYRGRGLIQLTGRANYQAAELALRRPYVQRPELVAEPEDAARTAAYWWQANGCNALADAGDVDAITRAVNGSAMQGRAHRAQLTAEYLAALEAIA